VRAACEPREATFLLVEGPLLLLREELLFERVIGIGTVIIAQMVYE
jgi:hypothetical protein